MSELQALEKKVLPFVSKPARYTGGEMGEIRKDFDSAQLKIALSYPDLYEVGMSSPGIQLLYFLLNALDTVVCERFFAPATDLEEKLIQYQLPLFSLESQKDLKAFDWIGFSLQHESVYTNLLHCLQLAKIPLLRQDRTPAHPLIFAGGPSAANPLPMSDFVDLFIVGDAEELLPELIQLHSQYPNRQSFLEQATQIEGVFVSGISKQVKKRIYNRTKPESQKHLIPLIDTIHYRANLELMRGCPKFCRFCHASYTNKPVRSFNPSDLVLQAEQLLNNSGYGELGLSSLSSGDYPHIQELSEQLVEKFENQSVKISLPSLRADSVSDKLLQTLQKNYKTGITIAPEAGTQRLRNVIRKEITEDDILNSIRMAISAGCSKIKLYFMIGLPTETQADIDGIIDLSIKIKKIISFKRKIQVTFSMSSFIPKPHTPFQWATQMSMEEIDQKQKYLAQKLTDHQFKFRWHDRQMSLVEGLLSRSGVEMGKVILTAYQKGCRFDAWQEHFQFDKWMQAFAEHEVSISDRLAAIPVDQILPWDIVDTGLSKDFLLREYREALSEATHTL